MIRSQRSPYGTSLLGAGAVHHIRIRPLRHVRVESVLPPTSDIGWSAGTAEKCQELSHSNSDDLTTCALCACDHTGLRSNSCRSAA